MQAGVHRPLNACTHRWRPAPTHQCRARGTSTLTHSRWTGADGLLVVALEKVLNQITSLLADNEAKQLRLRTARRGSGAASVSETEVIQTSQGKRVKFSCSTSGELLVKESIAGCTAAGKGLSDYLELPIAEYSLLDPRWISQPDPDNEPDIFLLKVPLQDLVGLTLQPQVTIRVTLDDDNQVQFFAERFQLGEPRFDENFFLVMEATLSQKPVTDVGGSLRNAWRAISGNRIKRSQHTPSLPASDASNATSGSSVAVDSLVHLSTGQIQDSSNPQLSPASSIPAPSGRVDQGELAHSTALSDSPSNPNTIEILSTPESGTSDSSTTGSVGGELRAASAPVAPVPDAGILSCKVSVKFDIGFPPPLSIVPGPMLALAGSLVARLTAQALLPGFLKLLAADYSRWAASTGPRVKITGSLIPTTPHNTTASEQPPQPDAVEVVGVKTNMGVMSAILEAEEELEEAVEEKLVVAAAGVEAALLIKTGTH